IYIETKARPKYILKGKNSVK
ncbi:glycosyl transferase family 2, partial [Salmonella enterica subsp. enterica]|nr:glycosyl transferase family 2 [Salmonella enterica]EAW1388312.1 glycosyl transferase family 2 [Salmonella enterica subsp. enterica]EBN0624286.1 glycosyl transferase family 2 [Salmonella enterica subsp. enterica serovar Lille]ECG3187975.1 glycosyl transferase family 2 [Salmonella enterica subsp. enterica serovar Infantis]EBB6613806.1 glycosyl transferase family 2 [Salmonella enterica]